MTETESQESSWSPQNPGINDSDILKYAAYLRDYAAANPKPRWFCDSVKDYFREHLELDVINGKTRRQWIDANEKRFAILEVGTYDLTFTPEDFTTKDGLIEIASRCILDLWDNNVTAPWGKMERQIDVEPTHSELDIEKLELPMFSQSEHCKKVALS